MRVQKRLRMTLDFEVTVEELTDERLREHYRRSADYDELVGNAELWANLSRQIRLRRALLEDAEALGRFLTYVVTDEVDPSLDGRLGGVFGVGGGRSEEEILGPLFSWLGEEDARYFREVTAAGALFENIEVLGRSFLVRWTGASIDEIRPVREGKFDETESAHLRSPHATNWTSSEG